MRRVIKQAVEGRRVRPAGGEAIATCPQRLVRRQPRLQRVPGVRVEFAVEIAG